MEFDMNQLNEKIKKISIEDKRDIDEDKFIIEFINLFWQEYLNIRSGGVSAMIPKPDVKKANRDTEIKAILILENAAEELCELESQIEIPLFALVDYFKDSLKITDSDLFKMG